jgi:hypothetical protein
MDAEGITVEQLTAAIHVLAQLAALAGRLPAEQGAGASMHRHIAIAELYLMEYQRHLTDGMEPYAALLATAQAGPNSAEAEQGQ